MTFILKLKLEYEYERSLKMKFAKINNRTFLKLMVVDIDDMFISAEAMGKIKKILELDGKTAEELTAIRNTVVKTIDEEFISPALEEQLQRIQNVRNKVVWNHSNDRP